MSKSLWYILAIGLLVALLVGCSNPAGGSTPPSTSTTTYTVTYNGNGSTSGTVPTDSNQYSIGTSVTILGNTGSLAKAGYTFTGWNTLSNGTGTGYVAAATFTMGSSNIVLYAQWMTTSNTVSFNANGGTGTMANQTIATGSSANLTTNTFTYAGYTFSGWNTAANGSGTAYANGASYTMGASSVTLYAQWMAASNTVSFNANGGTGTMANQIIATGSSANLTTNAFTYAGYTFSGWNTAANGSGTAYANGASYAMGASSVTLYAQWTANLNTVTFNANGGTGTMANQTIATGSSANLTTNAFTYTGYTFSGWNTAANGSGTAHANGASYTMGASSVTLYAQWTANLNTVSFNANGGTGTMANQSIATGATATLTANSFSQAGYAFNGWNTMANGWGMTYANGASYSMGASSVILYAQWSPTTNTITFNANGGTGTMANQLIATGATATLTANSFSQAGYSFNGWNTLANGTGTAYANGASYTMGVANVTLFAQWTQAPGLFVSTGGGNGSDNITAFAIGYDGALTSTSSDSISVGSNSYEIAISPNGKYLYGTNLASTGSKGINVYQVGASGVLSAIKTGTFNAGANPTGIAVTPNGNYCYVTNQGSTNGINGISAYTIGSNGALTAIGSGTFTTGPSPIGIAISPNGNYLYITNYSSVGTNGISAFTISSDGSLSAITSGTFTTGVNPIAVAVSPNGSYLYVTNHGSTGTNGISVFSIGSDGALTAVTTGTFATGLRPYGVVVTPNSSYVYLVNYGSTGTNGISAYSIGSGGALTAITSGTFSAGTTPFGIAVSTSGAYLYATNSGSAGANAISAYTIGAGGELTAITSGTLTVDGGYPMGIVNAP